MKLLVDIKDVNNLLIEEIAGQILLDKEHLTFEAKKISDSKFLLQYQNKSYTILIVDFSPSLLTLNINGYELEISSKDEIAIMLDKLGMDVEESTEIKEVTAPMPGLILGININEGDTLNTGDGILVLEAMKMENLIKSPVSATVSKVHVSQGQNVEKNQLLVSF